MSYLKIPTTIALLTALTGCGLTQSKKDIAQTETDSPTLTIKLDQINLNDGEGWVGQVILTNHSEEQIKVSPHTRYEVNLKRDGQPVERTRLIGSGLFFEKEYRKSIVTIEPGESTVIEQFEPYDEFKNDEFKNQISYNIGDTHMGWDLAPGEYSLSLTWIEDGKYAEWANVPELWEGTVASNEVVFKIKPTP